MLTRIRRGVLPRVLALRGVSHHVQVKPAVIESWQYESKDFRKIRLTYIDAGIGAQVQSPRVLSVRACRSRSRALSLRLAHRDPARCRSALSICSLTHTHTHTHTQGITYTRSSSAAS